MKIMITVLFMHLALISFAQGDTLTARKAKSQTGKEVIVKAVVAGSKLIEKDGNRILILSLDKPNPKTSLMIVFFNKSLADLNPQYLLDGKTIVVKGRVTTYDGRSQIIVNDVENFKVVSN
ncbi:MAG TPA: hypothetical protein VHL77_10960 [Ferruginibacter sp.]|jgi:DNA/RNA endonuclease YhcR with UshA esterase domain|nr:hypothetical protein [Ferruginibacter sp.]